MRRAIAVVVVVLATGAGAVLTYLVAARQRDYRASLARGDAALKNDETFAAIEAYSGAIALRPDSMLGYLRRGETYRRRADRGDLDAAARDFRKAAALDQSAIRPLEELGDVRYQLQQYDRAVSAYERAVPLDDRSARLSYKLALARYAAGDVEGALTALEQTVRLDDRMADAYYLLGICLRDRARTADAIKALERAVAVAPALVPAREELSDLYGELGRRTDQIEQLQMLAGLDRERITRHVAVALAHARARHWDTAVLTLGGALERAPDDSPLYRALGQVWLESAMAKSDRVELSKAREALDRVASNASAGCEVLMLAGRAALQDGDVETAERRLQQATERYPVDPAALLLYATVAERQNHLDAARRALIQYEALVRSDAELATHAAKIATLSLRMSDVETADAWIKRGLDADPQNAQLAILASHRAR